jgi:hypothetical protein
MRILDALLQRFLRWYRLTITGVTPFTDGVRNLGTSLRSIEASDAAGEVAPEPVPVPLTPEQQADQDLRAWHCKWLRYVRIRRENSAKGFVSDINDLESAWNYLRGTFEGIELLVHDPRKLRRLIVADLDCESDPAKFVNVQRRAILADIDFLIADATVAPSPDEDRTPTEGRSAEAATFGNYLNRW